MNLESKKNKNHNHEIRMKRRSFEHNKVSNITIIFMLAIHILNCIN